MERMMKLHRPRSRSFSKDNTNCKSNQAEEANSINKLGSRVEFPAELARSLQAFASSLSPASTAAKTSASRAPAELDSPAPAPLKPILRRAASAGALIDSRENYTQHRTTFSTSSTSSQKQISFLQPECPTAWGAAVSPQYPLKTSSQHGRHESGDSTASAASSNPKRVAFASTSNNATKLHKDNQSISSSSSSRTASISNKPVAHIEADDDSDIMHITNPVISTSSSKRSSTDSMSKELPPLPLNASRPSSSSSFQSSILQPAHRRNESASSTASSVLSNPVHLPRLKLGELTFGFPQDYLSNSQNNPSPVSAKPEERRFAGWLGLTSGRLSSSLGSGGRKRDSAESKRSSAASGRRRSDTSIQSVAMSKHTRSRSSNLEMVPETEAADVTLNAASFRNMKAQSSSAASRTPRPVVERSRASNTRDEAARMTQLWVTLLEDFVLLCDDSSMPSSNRSSLASVSSALAGPSTVDSLLPPSSGSDDSTPCPLSPAPSSECDPFLRRPGGLAPPIITRKKSKPLPPSPMPSLDVNESTGSTTYTYSPSTPLSLASSPNAGPATSGDHRTSFNPFEASFGEEALPSSSTSTTTAVSASRRASLPGHIASTSASASSSDYSANRPGKQRPPPLHLISISDHDETHTVSKTAYQTEAQTMYFTSQRSKSLPSSDLQPRMSYRQPVSPTKRDESDQLGASTSSTGSGNGNRASRRYHFPSSAYAESAAMTLTFASSTGGASFGGRRNKSIDEGYVGTGLTPTPTSDTFSIPSRSREASVSSTSYERRGSAVTTAATSVLGTRSASLSAASTPEKKSSTSTPSSSASSTPNKKTSEAMSRTRRSQSASEHVRKSSNEAAHMKRSPTLEIVMYGVAL